MDNIFEVITLIRKQSELGLQILNGHGAAAATERELQATWHRLTTHPHALSAVVQTARAMRRTPDVILVQDVADWGCST